MTLKNIAVMALVLVGLVFAGCEKEEMNVEINKNLLLPKNCLVENNNNVSETFNQERELLSIVIAKSMQNPEFRMFIKEEALKQFDGDYDVLFQNVKNKNIAKGKTVEDFLFDFYLNEKGVNASKSDFKKIIESIPDFQISVPVNCEKWDAETEIPLVTYIPVDFDEQTTKYVNAYDYKGNLYTLSTQDEPDVAIIVLGSCERMDYVASNSIVEKIENNIKGNRSGVHYERLKGFYFSDLAQFETWLQGKPEIYIDVYKGDGTSYLKTAYFHPQRKMCDKHWKLFDMPLFYWSSNVGQTYLYYWFEKDGNWTLASGASIAFIIKGVSVNIQLFEVKKDNSEIDVMGRQGVDYSEPIPQTYDCGNLQFKVDYY